MPVLCHGGGGAGAVTSPVRAKIGRVLAGVVWALILILPGWLDAPYALLGTVSGSP